MSGIASLFNIPGTPEELLHWSAAHATHHRDINRRLYELTGANFVEFVIDPIDMRNQGVWAQQHQILHFNMDAVLGIEGFDLTEVDFLNRDLMTGWIQLNASEHFQAANTLGIG